MLSRAGPDVPKPCAFCGKGPRVPDFSPFCSRGCQDRDLLQWLREGYAVPATSDDDELADAGQRTAPLDKPDIAG